MAAQTAAAREMVGLLSKGMEVYLSLKGEMEKALGLKAYATKLQQINQTMDGVRQFLSESEKDIADVLSDAHHLSTEGLQKAVIVVSVIKEQSRTLISVLTPSTNDDQEKKDKMYAACLYFSEFAKAAEDKVNEAQEKLLAASNKLFDAKSKLGTVVATLKRVQDGFVEKAKEAIAHEQAVAYGGAALQWSFSRTNWANHFLQRCGRCHTRIHC